jgi:GNAT superfamily N-acetyltransferase
MTDGPRMPEPVLSGFLRLTFSGDPAETWFIPGDAPGNVIGWYRLALPDLENRPHAGLLIVVDPARRRRGLGRALLEHAAAHAAAAERSVLGSEVRDGSAGDAFATAIGAKTGIAGAIRRLDLRAAPAGKTVELGVADALAAAG